MSSRDVEVYLGRIADALESIEEGIDHIEYNTAREETISDQAQLFDVHLFYHNRLMEIITTDENADAYKKAQQLRLLLKESTEALESLAAK